MLSIPENLLSVLDLVPLAPLDRDETAADRVAEARFAANVAALSRINPELAHDVAEIPVALTWTYGRDGFLTARDDAGFWWTGCSVPLAAARDIFKNLELGGTVGCFLCPTHAGQIRAVFEKVGRSQAVIAIFPDLTDLAVALRCEDFVAEIQAKRLFFIAGLDWSRPLGELFQANPGLPVPQQFIRTLLLDETVLNLMIAEAQGVFARETARRAQRIELLRGKSERRIHPTGRICVVAPSEFRLSDLSGPALRSALIDDESHESAFFAIDSDTPMSASPLALTLAAQEADLIITANTARSDLPGVIPLNVPWVTWITRGHIPAPDPGAPLDAIFIADATWQKAAEKAGWDKTRIGIASWPSFAVPLKNQGDLLGLIADTNSLDVPKTLATFSSHCILWEFIADELAGDPLVVGGDADAYLTDRMSRMRVSEEGFNRAMFIHNLIEPAFGQAIARAMIREKLPVALIGKGWMDIPELCDHATGPIECLNDLMTAAGGCGALVYPAIKLGANPFQTLGIPVLQPEGRNLAAFLRRCQKASGTATEQASLPLSPGRILSLSRCFTFGQVESAE